MNEEVKEFMNTYIRMNALNKVIDMYKYTMSVEYRAILTNRLVDTIKKLDKMVAEGKTDLIKAHREEALQLLTKENIEKVGMEAINIKDWELPSELMTAIINMSKGFKL